MIEQHLKMIAACGGVDISGMSVDDFLSGGFEDAAVQANHKAGSTIPLLFSQ